MGQTRQGKAPEERRVRAHKGQATGPAHLELLKLSAVRDGEGVVIRWKAERQPADKAVRQLSELCERQKTTRNVERKTVEPYHT